ncbi:hypothetical protein AB8U03_10575 [Clostridium sp. Mt-5]|uniref:Uncharacterized protein n=1 Tax=Clostridium moutaii TaxID=3240932 RepID=A0ABV4BPD5_9CLOT
MDLTTEDMIKNKLLDVQENVRDFQEYSKKIDNKEINEKFKQFAKGSALEAQELEKLLNKYGK